MANSPKRASMREGPLAALFRKTEEGEDAGEAGVVAAPGPSSSEEAKPRPRRREAGARGDAAAAEPTAERQTERSREREPEPERERERKRRRELPHPALSASPPEPEQPVSVPSPQERLRHVFSSEIPENIMDRPSQSSGRAGGNRASAQLDAYAREEPRPFDPTGPVIQPVIRVVGVGGAGVNAVNRMVEAEVVGV
jgi:cell division protein FtsZ